MISVLLVFSWSLLDRSQLTTQCIMKYGAVVPHTKTVSVNRTRKSECHQHSDEGSAHCPVSTSAVQQYTKETEWGQELTLEVHRIQ